ncbi:hypothetical protein QTV49_005067 [Vibrio vulnificus]|nr:hypothetical protein [Vibrio vulnificus]
MNKPRNNKKKPIRYELYKTQFQRLATDKKLAKYAKEKLGEISAETAYTHFAQTADYLHDSIGHICGAEELYWLKKSRKAIFLTKDLISMLLRATFSLEQCGTIAQLNDLKSFCVAIPKGTTMKTESGKEIKVHPFLFSMMPLREWLKSVKSEYLATTGSDFETDPELLADKDEVILTLTYTTEDSVLYQTVEKLSNLPSILATGIRDKKYIDNYQILDNDERTQSTMMLKLALSFMIYSSAKQGTNLVDGYPPNCIFDMGAGFTRTFWNPSTADYKPLWLGKKEESEVIGAHFRNLSDESDYQGEYAWMPVGSLWEFIDEH